jgi:hypothetical protein
VSLKSKTDIWHNYHLEDASEIDAKKKGKKSIQPSGINCLAGLPTLSPTTYPGHVCGLYGRQVHDKVLGNSSAM